MILSSLNKFCHETIDRFVNSKSIVIDATCGNGNDTLYLATKVTKGLVYSFDIQQEAIDKAMVKTSGYENIKYITDSHSNLDTYIKENIDLIIFNLGYLPHSESSVSTKYETTIEAIEKAIPLLNKQGCIFITIYTKHDDHEEENGLLKYISTLSKYEFNILKYQFLNLEEAPYTIVIEKK